MRLIRRKKPIEKEIYSYFAEYGPQSGAYKEYLLAIPGSYIHGNKNIQDVLVENVKKLEHFSEEVKERKQAEEEAGREKSERETLSCVLVAGAILPTYLSADAVDFKRRFLWKDLAGQMLCSS